MVVTHDLEFARAVSDLIAILIDGRIAQIGPADLVLHSERAGVQAFLAGRPTERWTRARPGGRGTLQQSAWACSSW